jgi:hypothetical protein
MGEVDSAHLHRLGVAVEQISRLQQIVCDPNFCPWRTRQVSPGSEEVEAVVHWADEQLQAVVRAHDQGMNSKDRQVTEEVLRCSKELQQWSPSGGYCVTIPYHYGEQRELKPDELLKIAAGMEVAGCRAAAGSGGAGAGAAVAGGRICETPQIAAGTKGTSQGGGLVPCGRVLFPLKRANIAAFGLCDRAAGRSNVVSSRGR